MFKSLQTPAGWLALLLNFGSMGLMILAFFRDTPALESVLLVLPWLIIGIAAASRGRIRLIAPRGDPDPQLSAAMVAPGVGLAMISFGGNQHPLNWMDLLHACAGVTLGIAAAAIIADPRSRRSFSSIIGLVAISLFYGGGSVGLLNMRFDDSRGDLFAARVLDKRSTAGRNRSYNLMLEPWGPRTAAEEISVSAAFYHDVAIGQSVCIDLHPGALSTPWINTHRC